MGTGSITSYIDVAQIALYVFWIFFAALIYYLHAEDKREGYPLESDRSASVDVQGFPPVPKPRPYRLRDGRVIMSPGYRVSRQVLGGAAIQRHLGAPLEPIGDPMLAAVGPGAYADRADVADTTAEDLPRIVPMRAAAGYTIQRGDPDPRGLPVIAADRAIAGTVVDVWVDRAEALFRYLEVEVTVTTPARRVLLPMGFARVSGQRVQVRSILASQFANVPVTRDPVSVTLLEEDKIMAYYGGGVLYAVPHRQEPLL